LNPNNGKTVWNTLIGPGTSLGGIEWGSAYDGSRIYASESDWFGPSYGLEGSTDPSQQVQGGSWAALNPATGAFDWQVPTPDSSPAPGPVSVANGVMYGESTSTSGASLFALDASNGNILWSYNTGSSSFGGAAIANGMVYWGSGYTHLGPFFTGNNKFYGFGLPGS
jgi:polyvinyl alcohol dehydrogenase (cytochrome)